MVVSGDLFIFYGLLKQGAVCSKRRLVMMW